MNLAIDRLGASGVLAPRDLPALQAACRRIERIMAPPTGEAAGIWYSGQAVIEMSGQREGIRRLRELRREWTIERRRLEGRREWQYRLVRPAPDETGQLRLWDGTA